MLVEGKIPAGTVCPFREDCEIAKDGGCYHKGEQHTVPYSCASARGFEIVKKYNVTGSTENANPCKG